MVLQFLFTLGIIVEAITGAMAAGRKKVDWFGVIIIACVTALGGGTVRDIVLDTHPLIWIQTPFFLLVAAIASTLTIILAPSILKVMRIFLILDALGLATFVVIGTEKAIQLEFPFSICVISGMLTGISGGMLRDILCNDIPLVLRKEIYAIIAVFGAIMYWLLTHFHVHHSIAVTLTLVSIFSIRVYAIIYHIEMPIFDYNASLKQSAKNKH